MDPRTLRLWDEMLDRFRALGGAAENVCLKDGRFGRGLFPVDPAKPVRLHVPDSLLLDVEHAAVEGDAFRIAPAAPLGARERAFLEDYQREFSWGASRRPIVALLQAMHEAPAELRELLKGSPWLAGPTPEAIRERFFAARTIGYKGRVVLMPILELTNHGHAALFDKRDGIGLSGRFDGEILVRYRHCDPLQIFGQWGFASSEAFALSMPLALDSGSRSLVIGLVDRVELVPGRKPFCPDVAIEGGRMTLSYLMLGHRNYPRLARGTFYRIMQDAGLPGAEQAFDRIQHLNRMRLHEMIAASENAAPALGKLLRDVAQRQLQAMSHSFGARDV